MTPPYATLLDHVTQAGMQVFAVGKIWDILLGKGITKAFHTKGNMDGVDQDIRGHGTIGKGSGLRTW